MGLETLLKGIQTVMVICDQFGDTGKGKISDFIANWADINARGTGGNNAGHMTVVNGKQRSFHLLPAGITYDKDGKITMLGNGMVLDVAVLCDELDSLDGEGDPYNNLMISEDAHIILPFHILRDEQKNTSLTSGVGSTGKGIGPCYADKIARRGVMVRDLYNKNVLAEKLRKLSEFYPDLDVNIDTTIDELIPRAKRLKPFVRNTIAEMQKFKQEGKRILIEGAQGLLLSIEYGTYPNVTSSDCSINGTATGVGLSARDIDLPLGVVKFPYMTRVGKGPLPTEFGGRRSEEYCAAGLEHDLHYELQTYGIPFQEINGRPNYDHHHERIIELQNSDDPFAQGVGIRLAGEEYGTTTGRPRRTGWTDLVALQYAASINGLNFILTKPDVLQGAKAIKLATAYQFGGTATSNFTRNSRKLYRAKPRYVNFPGFTEDLSQIEHYDGLPRGLKQSIAFLEQFTRGRVRIISTGADRTQTIVR